MKQLLLVIDAQQELIEGNQEEAAVFNKEHLISNINLAVEKALKAEIPIVFVRDLDVAEGKGEGFQIHQNINVPRDVKIIDKAATNAFYGTDLSEHLKHEGTEHVVIMGCATQHCIDSAVRTATVTGLDVTLVGDGHSTKDSKSLSAEQIIKHHNEALHGHYNVDHFALVRSVEEDIFDPAHESYR